MTETIDTAQPEALRLANSLFTAAAGSDAGIYTGTMRAAAAELRRLHAESTKWQGQHDRDSRELRELCEARDTARRERDDAKAALAAAEARNATLTDDAARYRYLRNDVLVDGEICEDLYVAVDQPAYPNSWALTGAELDQAVDAARAFLSGATKESTDHG